MSLAHPRPAELAESLGERAEALCATLSPSGSEAELCTELEVWARALFPAVQRVKSSLVVWVDGVPPPDSGRPLIALVGHLDTVPIPEADRGRQPRREGGGSTARARRT